MPASYLQALGATKSSFWITPPGYHTKILLFYREVGPRRGPVGIDYEAQGGYGGRRSDPEAIPCALAGNTSTGRRFRLPMANAALPDGDGSGNAEVLYPPETIRSLRILYGTWAPKVDGNSCTDPLVRWYEGPNSGYGLGVHGSVGPDFRVSLSGGPKLDPSYEATRATFRWKLRRGYEMCSVRIAAVGKPEFVSSASSGSYSVDISGPTQIEHAFFAVRRTANPRHTS